MVRIGLLLVLCGEERNGGVEVAFWIPGVKRWPILVYHLVDMSLRTLMSEEVGVEKTRRCRTRPMKMDPVSRQEMGELGFYLVSAQQLQHCFAQRKEKDEGMGRGRPRVFCVRLRGSRFTTPLHFQQNGGAVPKGELNASGLLTSCRLPVVKSLNSVKVKDGPPGI